jgi:hypothetical protein
MLLDGRGEKVNKVITSGQCCLIGSKKREREKLKKIAVGSKFLAIIHLAKL